MNLNISFGDLLKKLRTEKGLPLREVALCLGIDTSTLGKIEKNNRKPGKLILRKVSEYYKVELKDLEICLLSDKIALKMYNEKYASEALKIAFNKINRVNTQRK